MEGSSTMGLTGAYDVDVVGNYAYVSSYGDLGVEVVDISDPTAPVSAGRITNSPAQLTYPRGITIVGNQAYVASTYGLEIMDIGGAVLTSAEIGSLKVTSAYIQNLSVSGSRSSFNGTFNVNLPDDQLNVFDIKQDSNNYFNINTTNGSETLALATLLLIHPITSWAPVMPPLAVVQTSVTLPLTQPTLSSVLVPRPLAVT